MTPTGSRSRSSGRSELRWSEVRTGAGLLAALALVLAAVFLSDIVLRELSEGPRVTVAAAEARALEPGSPVWVGGVPAGRVTAIRFRHARREEQPPILIRAVLREDAAGTLRADATAQIRAPALLAPSVLALRPGRADRPFDFGDTLRAEPPLDRQDVRARIDSLSDALVALEPLADSLGSRLTEGPGTLAALRGDEALRAELRRAADRVLRLAGEVPGGTAARLAADTTATASLERSVDRVRRLAEGLRAEAGRGDSLTREMALLAERLGSLARRLETGRGTLGRLLHDEALHRERRRLEAQMDSLRAEVLADPLRWLRVRLF